MSPEPSTTNSIQAALQNLLAAIKDAAQLDVETYLYYVDKKSDDPEQGKKVAQTQLKLDGDTNVWIPVQSTKGDVEVKQELYDLHNLNVEKATQRRSELLETAKSMVGELKNLLE
jgi:hypothetical protein